MRLVAMSSPPVVADAESRRRLALENAIASGELEGIEYTPYARPAGACEPRFADRGGV